MSTPSGKPRSPIDLSAYEPRKAVEQAAAEPHPSQGKTDPLRSSSLQGAHEPAGMERHPVENDRDPLRSPYAPTKARGQPAVAADFFTSDDAEPPPPTMRAREGSRERPAGERHARGGGDLPPKTALEEGIRGGHPVDRGAAASLQPAHSSSGRHQPPAAQRRDEIMREIDLERLEASLRWLQRQETAMRLPRATASPPVSGGTGRHHDSEMPVDSLRAPRSLEPERLAPPIVLRSQRDNLRWPLGIVVASIFAAPIAYYFSVGSWVPPPELAPPIESLDQAIVAPPLKGAQTSRPSSAHQDPERSVPVEMSAERTGISQTARSSESETVAMPQGGTGTQAASPGEVNRALDPEEIKLLTSQGEQFAAAGDLVTARILLQRAAEAGDAAAAMALGATYDPNVLAKRGVVGINADVEKARSWYQKAERFGSPEASQRLSALANR